jgi:uncharacterized protein YndB with AHSA1/START domain
VKVEKRLELKATVERVWSAITDPAEIQQWFPDRATLEPRAGGKGAWDWDEYGSHEVRVEVFEPPTKLVWSWAADGNVPYDEATATRVEWTLTPIDGGGTLLELVETGFASLKSRQENDDGWDSELGELVEYLEKVPMLEETP